MRPPGLVRDDGATLFSALPAFSARDEEALPIAMPPRRAGRMAPREPYSPSSVHRYSNGHHEQDPEVEMVRPSHSFASALPPLAVPFALATAQHGQHHGAEALGSVRFSTSCAAAVQPTFDRAVAMLHSFWFEQANAAFEEVATRDPSCAMAQWGIAMTALGNPFVGQPIPEPRLRAAIAASARAESLAVKATERERLYAAAASALYRGALESGRRARNAEHESAMRAVHERFPDDVEAALFHARAMIA